MTLAWLILAVLAIGCGSSPTSPTPQPTPIPSPSPSPTPAPAPTPTPTPSFTGTVTDTVTGATVSGYTATLNGSRVTVSAPGYLTRETRNGASVDLIPERGFDLGFYRQFARDDFGRDRGGNEPLWVLQQSPSFYMEVEGAKGLSAAVAVRLEAVARRIVPLMTGGRLQVARWETGPSPRAPQDGWIMVERRDENGVCGRALIGNVAGQIWLDGNGQGCSFESVFAHEIGHALGFFHVDRSGAMMFPQQRNSNLADSPSDIERAHAAIAYARPRGNRDVDVDPSSFAGLLAPSLVVD